MEEESRRSACKVDVHVGRCRVLGHQSNHRGGHRGEPKNGPFQRNPALRAGTDSCLNSFDLRSTLAHFKLTHFYQTEGDPTFLFDRAIGKSLVRFPRCATVQTHFHIPLLSFAHKGHHIHFLLERKDVRRCSATNCTSCCASRYLCARASPGRKWSFWP